MRDLVRNEAPDPPSLPVPQVVLAAARRHGRPRVVVAEAVKKQAKDLQHALLQRLKLPRNHQKYLTYSGWVGRVPHCGARSAAGRRGPNMLEVQAVSRSTIDAWSVAESGLPVRVVNSTRTAQVETIGQLRRWSDADLLRLRSLGRISVEHIHFFFRLCGQIEQGQQRFQSIQDIFDIFLDKPEQFVIGARYGLSREAMKASRNCMTLQEIGNSQQKTRERVRQIEEAAKMRLQSRLAKVCLRPFVQYGTAFIAGLGDAAAASDLAPLRSNVVMGGHNPCGIFLLLHDVDPTGITYRHNFFSSLPAAALEAIEKAALQRLGRETKLLPLQQLLQAVADQLDPLHLAHPERVVGVVLDHIDDVGSTIKNRYFLFERGMSAFLVELLRNMDRPAHYRAVTNQYNAMVKPSSRKGAGFILDALNTCPACVRVERGMYDLR